MVFIGGICEKSNMCLQTGIHIWSQGCAIGSGIEYGSPCFLLRTQSTFPLSTNDKQYLFCVPDPYRPALRQKHLMDIVHIFSKMFCDG